MEIYGLVVAGGRSSRMGTDKAWLNYHGQPQAFYLYDMLEQLCGKAAISCNLQQAPLIPGSYTVIIDAMPYQDKGPMAGLLSAFEQQPGKNLLVTGCDYPFIGTSHLHSLISSIRDFTRPAVFYNAVDDLYEPLIGLYPAVCYTAIKQQFEQGNFSIQYFLKACKAGKFLTADQTVLQSADTPAAFENAKKLLTQTIVS